MANERARHLRRNRTLAERRLWWKLRELKQAGFKFRQQLPVDGYIVDFVCLSKRLIIEVDGGTHSTDEEMARDARRERYLRSQGFRILRVWNSEVRENIDGVMDTIVDALGPPPPSPPRVMSKTCLRHDGEGRSLRHARAPHCELGVAERDARGRRATPSPSRKDVKRPSRRERAHRDPMLVLARQAAAAVVDPEIPVLTLEDLGVLRGVERRDGRIVVELTPTYTGCPATDAIRQAVELALVQAGIAGARVETVLSPPWSSDDITEEGRRKLRAFGVAPPSRGEKPPACPRCGSADTTRISEFGSTACKALWRCAACAEPFDYFKCI